jgi:hypothetical protein
MGLKGLVAHLECQVRLLIPYTLVNGISMVSTNLNVPAMEDRIEARERQIMEYEQKEYLSQQLILPSISPHLSQKLFQHTNAKVIQDKVKLDITAKSSLHQIDILNRLQTIKCLSSLD